MGYAARPATKASSPRRSASPTTPCATPSPPSSASSASSGRPSPPTRSSRPTKSTIAGWPRSTSPCSPPSGTGKLLWHALGAKTTELIHQNIHVEAIRDDLETLVLDESVLEIVLSGPDPKKKAQEVELKLIARLRKHGNNPAFRALSDRLEDLKARAEKGLVQSLDFLKQLLVLARDVVAAEKEVPPVEEVDRGKAALTDLFQQVKNETTPVMVERVVADIDAIVRLVRFPGWQQTSAGEREVKGVLRKTLLKYKLHQDTELFDKAYGYIKQYY